MAVLIANRYEILGKLGQGGQGSIYKARHVDLESFVALKLLPSHFADDPNLVARFRREARVQARFKHPHIVRVTDIVNDGGRYYLVMDYVEGHDLRRHLQTNGRLSVKTALEIAEQVGEALAYAHRHGVVHRDVKPSNILLESLDPLHAMLFDFGIAKEVDSGETMTGAYIGSYRYSAPEQLGLRNPGRENEPLPVDGRADVYALGHVLFEMCEGAALFAGFKEIELISRVVYGQDRLEPRFTVAVPPEVVGLVSRAIQRRPEDRFQAMHEMLSGIRRCLQAVGESAGSTVVTEAATRVSPQPWSAATEWHAAREGETDDATLVVGKGSRPRADADADQILEARWLEKRRHEERDREVAGGRADEPRSVEEAGPVAGPRRSGVATASVALAAVVALAVGGFYLHSRQSPEPTQRQTSPDGQAATGQAKPAVRPLAWTRLSPDGESLTITEGKALAFAAAVVADPGGAPSHLSWYLDGKLQADGSEWQYQPGPGAAEQPREVKAVASVGDQTIEHTWRLRRERAERPAVVAEAQPASRPSAVTAPPPAVPPRIIGQIPGDGRIVRVKEGGSIDFRVQATSDAGAVTQTWFLDGTETHQGESWRFQAPVAKKASERHRIEVEVSSAAGLKAPRVGWDVEIDWVPPTIVDAKPRGANVSGTVGEGLDFSVVAKGAGDAQLQQEWTVDGTELHVTSDGKFRLPDNLGPGPHEVAVAAVDGRTVRSSPRKWQVTLAPPAGRVALAPPPAEAPAAAVRSPGTKESKRPGEADPQGAAPAPAFRPGGGVVAREVPVEHGTAPTSPGAAERVATQKPPEGVPAVPAPAVVAQPADVGVVARAQTRNETTAQGGTHGIVERDLGSDEPTVASARAGAATAARPGGGVVAREVPAGHAVPDVAPPIVPRPAAGEAVAAVRPQAGTGSVQLELLDLSHRLAKDKKTIAFEGKIRNDGQSAVEHVTLNVQALDDNDEALAVQSVLPSSLPLQPGQTATFRTELPYAKGIKTFNVVVIPR